MGANLPEGVTRWGGAWAWGRAGMTTGMGSCGNGASVAFIAYLGRLYGPLFQLAQLHVNILTSVALYRRIFTLLDREPEVRDGPMVLLPGTVRGAVALESVWFPYPRAHARTAEGALGAAGAGGGELAARGVEFAVPAGGLCALVGPSGAGKTTMLHLMPRFHDPSAGRATLDGVDLRAYSLQSLHQVIGLVPQEP